MHVPVCLITRQLLLPPVQSLDFYSAWTSASDDFSIGIARVLKLGQSLVSFGDESPPTTGSMGRAMVRVQGETPTS